MKKVILSTTLIALCLLFFNCASTKHVGSTSISKDRITREVEEIIKTTDKDVNLGIKIISLDDGKVVFERNAARHFVPASTMKLVTLAAALHYLGPSYRFETALFTDALDGESKNTAGATIKNIYLQGSGDPSLMDHDLMELASELKQRGVKHVSGTIYVDDQIFDDVLWSRGAMWDDRSRGFSAPICGLNFNYNRLLIKTVPGNRVGAKAFSIVKPHTSYIEVFGDALTRGETASHKLNYVVVNEKNQSRDWPSSTSDGLRRGDKVIVSGSIGKSSKPAYGLLAVNDPAIFAGTYLKDILETYGIKVEGNVARGKTPASARKLAVYQSRSLAEALIDFTKISNNIANDALVKAIAANASIKPATFSAGLKLIGDFLTDHVGINAASLIAADGAGASRYNLITPEQMVKLLSYAAKHFRMGPEFMAALPIGGEDGTLGGRMGAPNQRGQIRAKTGSLTGISALAGYLTGEDGNRYAFAIMVNGFVGSASKYLRMQEQILATMMRDTNQKQQLANVK